jgi:hypothetical protein
MDDIQSGSLAIGLYVGRVSADWLGIGTARGKIHDVDSMQTFSDEGKLNLLNHKKMRLKVDNMMIINMILIPGLYLCNFGKI